VLLGRRRVNQGTTFEAINMAVVLKLPAVFVFENNQYGEGTGVAYAVGSQDIAAGPAASAPSVKVDGDDSSPSMRPPARRSSAPLGGGPSAIEAIPAVSTATIRATRKLYRGKDEVKRLRDERDCLRISAAASARRRSSKWMRSMRSRPSRG